ncbi:tRNA 2-thiouridine(34) synthase MnmA [Candidatus Collierbacteria bacterium]|nr:tRNA 2-thiouridine(34) synthase MnmA [Candidatus Collierbacteria bacterium]
MNRAKIRVAVGISGGVDSAVTALLLKEAGCEVVGVHLYCWPPKEEYLVASSQYSVEEKESLRKEWVKKNGCRADEDKKFALKTALELDIPFVTLDFSEEYNLRVVDYFYREYEAGRTPNPDVMCNSEIKFGLFLDWALQNGFDFIATGHYAKIGQTLDENTGQTLDENTGQTRGPAPTRLFIPADRHKDQTYFLWKLTQKELKHVLFPLGDLEKNEVRKIALKAALPAGRQGLSVAGRPDSQGICFVGNVEARKFLARRLQKKMGEVKNISGEVIGTHDGVWFYTVGQRGGWTIDPKIQKLLAKPDHASRDKNSKTQKGDATPVFYVINKDAEKNELVVGVGKETERQRFEVGEVNWMGKSDTVTQCHVRIRHGGKLIAAEITPSPRNSEASPPNLGGEYEVKLFEPQRGVAPGQSAVFYSEEGELLGGGVIA